MAALVIAVGNTLRGDDGAAHCVPLPAGVQRRAVLQLTPEIAAELAGCDPVVFLDADQCARGLLLEHVEPAPFPALLAHVARPAEIIALARTLFGFSGQAYTCRIPAVDFAAGAPLSRRTRKLARQAGREIARLLRDAPA
jgi:Ni,Fe-hydrogenase maturation factor